MGGTGSHEFIALSETGEGVIVYSESGKFGATEEKAPVEYILPQAEDKKELEKFTLQMQALLKRLLTS